MVGQDIVNSLSPPILGISGVPDVGKTLHAPSPVSLLVPRAMRDSPLTGSAFHPPLSPKADDSDSLWRGDDWVSQVPEGLGMSRESGLVPAGVFSSGGDAGWGWSAEQICGVVVVAVIVPFILVSNLLVVVSVARFKRLQVPTNYFTLSLAAGDIVVALITPFFIVIEVLPGQVENPVLCLCPNRLLMTGCGVSVLTMAAIAYDRHTALVSPLKYVTLMTPRRVGLAVSAVWLYSAGIVWVPVLLGWFSARPAPVLPCSFRLLHDEAHVLFLSAIFGPACLVVSVCYFRILRVARQHARAIAAVESSVHHNLSVRFMIRDAKYARTLALVIGVFLALWTPYLACLLVQVVGSVVISPWLWNYLTLLAVLNSGLNPWIYAFKNNDFRAAFGKILKVCCSACCRFGSRSFCFHVLKDSRRSSALSAVNIFTTATTTTTTTSASPSRSTRSSEGSMTVSSRLSDVSCVISVDPVVTVSKVFNGDRRKSLVSTRRASVPVGIERGTFLQPAGGSTGKRVSALLNVDSKAFIEDLLGLYLQHSLVHSHSDIRSESSEADDQGDGHSAGPSDQADSHLGDRVYTNPAYECDRQTDDTCPCGDAHSEYVGCGDDCDRVDDAVSCQTDHAYHSDHSDPAEDTSVHGHTDDVWHVGRAYRRGQADVTFHSDTTDHSQSTDHSHGGDPTDCCHQSDHTVHSDSETAGHAQDSTEPVHHSGITQHCRCISVTRYVLHEDHTDRGYHSDHSDQQEHSSTHVSHR